MQANDWKPMSELPAELRDGRDVLFWAAKYDTCVVGYCTGSSYWETDGGYEYDSDFTHYCEIVQPAKEEASDG